LKDPAEFITDMSVWGMIHALTIRSPIAKGSLKEIKCPKLPASYHLITAKQIPGENRLADFPIPVLAGKELSYAGQPVAILAGPEKSVLEDLASGIAINTEEEKACFSITSNDPGDIVVIRDIIMGDPDMALGEGGIIVSGNYITEIQEHWYSEPHGALAVPFSDKGKKTEETLTVYTSTQWPYHVKHSIAGVLGWDEGRVTVTPTLMTVHLDGKLWYPSLVSCHAALAAMATRKPVKLMLRREEDFMYSPKRNKAEIQMCSTLGDNGDIHGSIIQVQLDLGSEGVFENEIMDQTCLGALGTCHHDTFKVDGTGIRTNIPPQGPMAGFGLSQGFFAAERHFSRIADYIGQDPAEWRKINSLKKNQSLAIGIPIKDPVPLVELIDAAASMGDYYRKWASYELLRKRRRGEKWEFASTPLRGIGIATAWQGNGFLNNDEAENGNYSVEITLEKDGFLEIKSSLISSGARYMDTWQNLAQDILGVDPPLVRLTSNTGEAPDSGPGTLSRNISSVTRLVEQCLTAIRKMRFRNPLPITVRRSIKAGTMPGWDPERNIEPYAYAHPAWGAVVTEIEIDPQSLDPNIRGIWLSVEGGRILNESRARRTLHTAVIQALGWTCREQLRYEEGKIPIECYRYYDIPTPESIPPIKVDFLKSGALHHKGIGELPFSCVPAAYVQAVSQAMDYHFEKIPLNVQDIWDVWKLKQMEASK